MKKFHREIEQVFRPLRRMQILSTLCFLTMLSERFLLLMETQKAVDSLPQGNIVHTMGYLKTCAILILLFFLINSVQQFVFRNLQYTSHYALMKSLFSLALKKDCRFHEKYPPPSVLAMVKDDSKFIADWKSIGIITVMGNLFAIVVTFVIIISYSPVVAFAVFLVIAFSFWATEYVSKKIGEKTYDLQVSGTEVNRRIIDYLNGFRDIRQYRKEKLFSSRLADFIDQDTYRHSKEMSRYMAMFVSIYGLLTTSLPVISILVGILLILNGDYTVGQMIATYAMTGNLQDSVQSVPEALNWRRKALAMQDKIMPLLENDKKEYSGSEVSSLEHFHFYSDSYTFEDGKKILEQVGFELKRGETVIVKGPSGRGKTSLLNLISRFHDIKGQPVSMDYNGIPAETIVPDIYYRHILQSRQSPCIFEGTVQDNLTLGDTYSEEELDEVIQVSCLEDFIEGKGLDYVIGQNGENISGGQKQRIGLARILLRKPDILMLDEPTSALNPSMVEEFTKRVIHYCRKYSIALIVVSHNDSFERYFQEHQLEVKVIQI